MGKNEGCGKCKFMRWEPYGSMGGVNQVPYCIENPHGTKKNHYTGKPYIYYDKCDIKNKSGKCKLFERKLSFFERIFC
jgi:hypothetical protein